MIKTFFKLGSKARYAIVAIVFFAVADNLNYVTRALGIREYMAPLAVTGIRDVVEVMLCFAGIMVGHGFGIRQSARELGLTAPIAPGLVFAFIATLPMLVAFAFTSTINPNMSALTIGIGCIIAPFAEEVLYRSFLFRQLYRRAGLGFWPAALLPSVLFALGHLYQTTDGWELAGILAITGLGGLLFCWVFMRWQDNTWAIFGLHALMNLWWEVFAVDNTALGGWVANIARAATVILAIVLTIYRGRIFRSWPGIRTA